MSTITPDFIADLQCVARTDVGMRRANNQDSHTVVLAADENAWRERGHLLMVADGMGAHAAGELASKIAVDNVPHLYSHYRGVAPPQALERAISDTNGEIHRRGLANPEFHSMGTTCCALVLLPQGALVGHVGDSRVYRLRDDCLEQLTFDHSLVWELEASGQITPNTDLARAVPKNVITRSLGPHPTVQVDLEGPFPLQIGDTFLLCSDGLSGQVADHEIGAILANLPIEEAATALIDLANLRGGPDNTTVLIAKVAGPGVASVVSADTPRAPAGRMRRLGGTPAAWVVAGICLVLALLLLTASQTIAAALLALAGGVAIVVSLVLGFRKGEPAATVMATDQRLGKGPYRKALCKPSAEFVQTLSSIVQELRSAAEEAGWQVNWEPFEALRQTAETAMRARRPADAVRSYAKAVSFIMNELRNQRRAPESDDTIQY